MIFHSRLSVFSLCPSTMSLESMVEPENKNKTFKYHQSKVLSFPDFLFSFHVSSIKFSKKKSQQTTRWYRTCLHSRGKSIAVRDFQRKCLNIKHNEYVHILNSIYKFDFRKLINYHVRPSGRSLCFWELVERHRRCGPSAGGWWPGGGASQINSSPGQGAPSLA